MKEPWGSLLQSAPHEIQCPWPPWGKKLENIHQSDVLEHTSRAFIGASGRIVWRTLRMGSWTLRCWFHSNQRFSHLVPVSCRGAVGLRAFGGTHPHHLRQKSFHKIQHWKAQTSIGQYTKTLLTIKRLSPKGKCWLEQHCTLSTFPKTDCCGLSALPRKVGSCRPPIFAKPLFVESLPLVLSVF